MGLNGHSFDGKRLYVTSANAIGLSGAGIPTGIAWNLVGGPNAGTTVYGGVLTALDPATGNIIWQNTGSAGMLPPLFNGLASASPILAGAFSANGVVYTVAAYPNIFLRLPVDPPNGGNLWAFNAETGELLLDTYVGTAFSTPQIVDGKVFVGTSFGEYGLVGLSFP